MTSWSTLRHWHVCICVSWGWRKVDRVVTMRFDSLINGCEKRIILRPGALQVQDFLERQGKIKILPSLVWLQGWQISPYLSQYKVKLSNSKNCPNMNRLLFGVVSATWLKVYIDKLNDLFVMYTKEKIQVRTGSLRSLFCLISNCYKILLK